MPTEAQRPGGDVATLAEVAKRLRIHRDRAYSLAAAGQLPGAFRLGRSWRVFLPTLEHALATGEMETR